MPYREDEDAALARADALQVDLDRTRAELEAAKAKLAANETKLELDASHPYRRERRSKPGRRPFVPNPPRQPRRPAARARSKRASNIVGWMVLLGFAVFVVFLVVVPALPADKRRARSLDLRRTGGTPAGAFTCTLHTVPEGAEVFAVTSLGERSLGTTPLAMPVGDWINVFADIEVRLPGFQTRSVARPALTTDRCETTYLLTRSD